MIFFNFEGINLIYEELIYIAKNTLIDGFLRARAEAVGIPMKPAPKTGTF
jgi:hypothetical protein